MDIVDIRTVDWRGRREDSFENAKTAFSPAMSIRGRLFNVLREKRSVGEPTGACAEENKMRKCLGQPRQALGLKEKSLFDFT
ncbi:hypothetical protein AM500_13720 [Bacillus sp. FJAT-18017]|nr:hypothetical protein AM500_13720 [Bacillus sp. FJAT-18017]